MQIQSHPDRAAATQLIERYQTRIAPDLTRAIYVNRLFTDESASFNLKGAAFFSAQMATDMAAQYPEAGDSDSNFARFYAASRLLMFVDETVEQHPDDPEQAIAKTADFVGRALSDLAPYYGPSQRAEVERVIVAMCAEAKPRARSTNELEFQEYLRLASSTNGIRLIAVNVAGIYGENELFQEHYGFFTELDTYMRLRTDLIPFKAGKDFLEPGRKNVLWQYMSAFGLSLNASHRALTALTASKREWLNAYLATHQDAVNTSKTLHAMLSFANAVEIITEHPLKFL